MILDIIKLSGENAYLRNNGDVNLADPNPSNPSDRIAKTGTHTDVGKGMLIEVSGIFIQIEGDDLLPLFQRQNSPILSIEVTKEIFPGLKKDPYEHRVHTIGGYDDFNRSTLVNLRVMEVDGYPTLVSVETSPCKWLSPVYQFSQPFALDSAAWYLPSAKLTPKDGFSYNLILHYWKSGEPLNQPSQHLVPLAADHTLPNAGRFVDGIYATANNIIAYQLEFNATVKHDTYLKERAVGGDSNESLGRPLLKNVNLLEVTQPRYDFYSLQELIIASAAHHFFEEHGSRLKKINVAVYITAALEEGESISITVYNNEIPASNKLNYVDARLAAEVKLKPPVIDKIV